MMCNVERKLQSVGKRTFINCFKYFFTNYKKSIYEIALNIPLYDIESSSNSTSSLIIKAIHAKQIFENRLEKEALSMCVNANRLDTQLKNKAENMLKAF